MRERLLAFILPNIVESLIAQFSLDTVIDWLDKMIDFIEDYINASPTKIDDSLLPLLLAVRNLLNIPDNDSAGSP